MTTILVDIPETLHRFKSSAHYTLLSPFGGSAQHHFVASEILQSGDSEVFRGTIRREGGKENVVICKLVKGKLAPLKREAAFYRQQLKPLQGRFVPQYYGYYEGTVSEEDEVVPLACILLQDCGRPIAREALMNDATKRLFLNVLAVIHGAGVSHNDFWGNDLRHVLVSEKNPRAIRIVDFDHGLPHTCKAKRVKMNDYEPPPAAFGCQELYDVAYAAGAWTPVVFQFLGRDYTIFRAATVPRLALLAQYDHKYDASKSEWLWNKAKEFIEDYYERFWSRFPTIGYPLEFKEPLDIPGVPEPVDIEPGEIPLWEEQRMEREARARAMEQSDTTANV